MRPVNGIERVPAATVRCILTVTCGEHFFLDAQRWMRIRRLAPSLSVQVSFAPRLILAMWPLSGVDCGDTRNALGETNALLITGGVTSSSCGGGSVGASTVIWRLYVSMLSSLSITCRPTVTGPAPV